MIETKVKYDLNFYAIAAPEHYDGVFFCMAPNMKMATEMSVKYIKCPTNKIIIRELDLSETNYTLSLPWGDPNCTIGDVVDLNLGKGDGRSLREFSCIYDSYEIHDMWLNPSGKFRVFE